MQMNIYEVLQFSIQYMTFDLEDGKFGAKVPSKVCVSV